MSGTVQIPGLPLLLTLEDDDLAMVREDSSNTDKHTPMSSILAYVESGISQVDFGNWSAITTLNLTDELLVNQSGNKKITFADFKIETLNFTDRSASLGLVDTDNFLINTGSTPLRVPFSDLKSAVESGISPVASGVAFNGLAEETAINSLNYVLIDQSGTNKKVQFSNLESSLSFFDGSSIGPIINLDMSGTLNFTTNSISDGQMTGSWNMNSGDLTWVKDLYIQPAGTLYLGNNNSLSDDNMFGDWNFNSGSLSGISNLAMTGQLSGVETISISQGADNSGYGISITNAASTNSVNQYMSGAVFRIGGTNGINLNTINKYVGVGKDPAYSLDVGSANSGGVNTLAISNLSNTISSDTRLLLRTAGSSSGSPYINWDISGVKNWFAGVNIADTSFRIFQNFGFANPEITITPDSRVGINTDNPSTSFEVNGTSTLDNVNVGGTIDFGTYSISDGVLAGGTWNISGGSIDNILSLNSNTTNLDLNVGYTTQMRFNSSGIIQVKNNAYLRSENYQSGIQGWSLGGPNDEAEINNIRARGMLETVVFRYNETSAVSGNVSFSSSTVLSADVGPTDTVFQLEDDGRFNVNDILRLRTPLQVEDVKVIATGVNTITVTRDIKNQHVTDPSWDAETPIFSVMDRLEATVNGADTPFYDVIVRTGDTTEASVARFGNINGVGTVGGFGLWAENVELTGKITATSGSFSGDVTTANIIATGGSIGGFDISSTYIRSTDLNLVLNSDGSATLGEVTIDGSGNTTIGGTLNGTDGTFTGTLSGVNGDFSGTVVTSNINATGGSIGGFTITGTQFKSTNNNIILNSDGSATLADASVTGTITTGNITATGGTVGGFSLTSSTFSGGNVTLNTNGSATIGGLTVDTGGNTSITGNVTATGGSFTGTVSTTNITATGGTIGGFQISSNYIRSSDLNIILNSDGSATLGEVTIDAVGNTTIGGTLNAVDGTFTGTLSGADGDFSGDVSTSNISATGGTIGGFTITGTQFKSSNGQIVLNSSGSAVLSNADVSGNISTSNITATGGTVGGFSLTSSKLSATGFDLLSGSVSGGDAIGIGLKTGYDTFRLERASGSSGNVEFSVKTTTSNSSAGLNAITNNGTLSMASIDAFGFNVIQSNRELQFQTTSGDIDITASGNVNISGAQFQSSRTVFSSLAEFNSTAQFDSTSNFNSTANFNSTVNFSGSGTVTFNKATDFNSSMSIDSTATFSSDVVLDNGNYITTNYDTTPANIKFSGQSPGSITPGSTTVISNGDELATGTPQYVNGYLNSIVTIPIAGRNDGGSGTETLSVTVNGYFTTCIASLSSKINYSVPNDAALWIQDTSYNDTTNQTTIDLACFTKNCRWSGTVTCIGRIDY